MGHDVKAVVRQKYGEAALRVVSGGRGSCCGPTCGCGPDGASDPITRDLYDGVTASTLPEAAVLASLGCGNPTALAQLAQGEVVLDLGSGGGIDVLLSCVFVDSRTTVAERRVRLKPGVARYVPRGNVPRPGHDVDERRG